MQSRILYIVLLWAALLSACTQARLPAPVGEQRRLHFVATVTTETLEVPLHGMLRMEPDAAGWRAERVGLALAHGPAVGVCRWHARRLVCEASELPGARNLLESVAVTAGELARHRGVGVDSPEPGGEPLEIVRRDATGAQEVRRAPRAGTIVTVRVTGDER